MGEPIASRADVARLLGRAAFGATSAQLAEWTGRPYAALVEHVLAVPPLASRLPQADDAVRLSAELGHNTELAQMWWLGRMKTTPYPLEERMTLFWHDHFATAVAGDGPTSRLLMTQNQTLRTHALGNFRALCHAITVDPAMLQWLDGEVSTLDHPNENYARELLELFTLGTVPQVYSETDIREAARALTGWTIEVVTPQALFNANRHDAGTKTFLGETIGNLGAEEYKRVVDIALAQPVSPKFVAYKMVQNFAYPPKTRDLFATPDPLVDEVATALATSGWDITAAMRALLMSDEFRYGEPRAVRQPVELAVHGAKAAGVPSDDVNLLNPIARAGQRLFQPPNVGGWPVGHSWLSTTTTIARYDLGVTLANVRAYTADAYLTPLPPSADILTGGSLWAERMGLDGLEPATLSAAQSYVQARQAAGAPELEVQNGIFILLLSSPDLEVM